MNERLKNILKIRTQYFWIILVILLVGGWFYWFQWRPMETKKECSWVEKHTDAIPELTQTQIDQAKIDYASCKKQNPAEKIKGGRGFFDNVVLPSDPNWETFNKAAECSNLAKIAESDPHPAIPSKAYYERADSTQYSFCLHSHGL